MALAAALVACGGGGSASGGAVAVTPTPSPTPSPSPSPTPTPTPTPGPTVTAITAPALAFAPAAPSSPQASAGGPTFATQPTASITFPVLQSTLALSNGVLAADTATMNAGSSFDFAYCSGCRETFALNVPSLGLSGVSLNTYADTPFFATLGDGREVRVEEATWGAGGFTSLKYGYWQIGTGFPSNYSAYVYGYETPGSALPSSGTAKYSGGVLGRVFLMTANGAIAGYVGGTATVQVDFAARTVVGYLTGVRYSDGVGDHEPWNDVSFTATLAAGSNRITGTAAAYSSSGSSGSLTGTATGTVAARFYGPGASEMGFVWTLSDGAKAAVGAGAAKG